MSKEVFSNLLVNLFLEGESVSMNVFLKNLDPKVTEKIFNERDNDMGKLISSIMKRSTRAINILNTIEQLTIFLKNQNYDLHRYLLEEDVDGNVFLIGMINRCIHRDD